MMNAMTNKTPATAKATCIPKTKISGVCVGYVVIDLPNFALMAAYKTDVTNVVPVIIPKLRDKAFNDPATPNLSCGAFDIINALFGDWKKAIPNPEPANNKPINNIGDSPSTKNHVNITIANTVKPNKVTYSRSILSANVPDKAEKTNMATGHSNMYIPDVPVLKPRKFSR